MNDSSDHDPNEDGQSDHLEEGEVISESDSRSISVNNAPLYQVVAGSAGKSKLFSVSLCLNNLTAQPCKWNGKS